MKYKCFFCDRISDHPEHSRNIDGDDWAFIHDFIGDYLCRPRRIHKWFAWWWEEIE